MRHLLLTEFKRSSLVGVTRSEAVALAQAVRGLRVEPSVVGGDGYDAVPGSTVGAIRLGDLSVTVRPKIPLDRLLFLVSYAVDPAAWRDTPMEFAPDDSIVEAIAPALVRLVARATHRGLLHGYRAREDALPTVRGQIRFGDQVRGRLGLVPPIEVRYDDFTADIDENRLLRAALHALATMRIRSIGTARGLRDVTALFDGVSLVRYDARQIPRPVITRLNGHYDAALRLARVVLEGSSFDIGAGGVSGTSFLLDMNEVFEAFVHRALAEALKLPETVFRRGAKGLHLDEAAAVRLEPDLSWWDGGQCRFVGDVKYKRLDAAGFKHGDLYQLLAYTTAAQLDWGLLIYAASESDPATHRVRFAGKTLSVAALDLSGTPVETLAAVHGLAERIRSSVNGVKA